MKKVAPIPFFTRFEEGPINFTRMHSETGPVNRPYQNFDLRIVVYHSIVSDKLWFIGLSTCL